MLKYVPAALKLFTFKGYSLQILRLRGQTIKLILGYSLMTVLIMEIKSEDIKLEIFLGKDRHNQRKLLNFENWCNEETSF